MVLQPIVSCDLCHQPLANFLFPKYLHILFYVVPPTGPWSLVLHHLSFQTMYYLATEQPSVIALIFLVSFSRSTSKFFLAICFRPLFCFYLQKFISIAYSFFVLLGVVPELHCTRSKILYVRYSIILQ